MPYTYKEYQTFYYLQQLLPVLENSWDYQRTILRFNNIKQDGLLVTLPKHASDDDEDLEEQAQAVLATLEKQSVFYPKLDKTPQQRNIAYLVKTFHLNTAEKRIIDFLSAVEHNQLLERTLNRFDHDLCESRLTLEKIANLSEGASEQILGEQAPLLKLGVLRHPSYDPHRYRFSHWLRGFINTIYKDKTSRRYALIGKPIAEPDPLEPEDFSYIEAADFAQKLMQKAADTKGFNILLYGNPGTGKTSFAKMLARKAGLLLYGVGETPNGTDEKNFRLCQLYRKQYLLGKDKQTCLLFDEAEDIFSSSCTRAHKVEINRLLENNTRPMLWTTNDIERMDPAFIRRFTLAVYFDKPSRAVREKMWKKHLAKYHLKIGEQDVSRLARTYEVPPAMIAGAARATQMINGNLDTLKTHLELTQQALHGSCKKAQENQKQEKFFPMLINADMDLSALTQRLKHLGCLNFSLCLYGASGTGKSAYARYLAQELGLDVIHRRASDLISPYVGMTERLIAKAFAQARDAKAMLIFDEADSFLRERTLAKNSWEISGVNEMLTWMESHAYPFICTTNLMDTLDTASLRRFNFKVKYDFLTPHQVCEAFNYFFTLNVQAQDVQDLSRLTPGDFALVKSKSEILGQNSFACVHEMLLNEQKIKNKTLQHTIGFSI